jgi:GAF domain/ANTAR domain
MIGKRHARLVARIAELGEAATVPDRICRTTVDVLEVSGAALILMSPDETGAIVAASDRIVESVEDLQFILGEGPCLRAYRTGAPVLVPYVARDAGWRWPMFDHQAANAGAAAVFAFPLQIGAVNLGALYLYRDREGMLSREQMADAFVLAEISSWVLLDIQAGAVDGELDRRLDKPWGHRAIVHQATGMLSAQLGITLVEALVRLRARAFSNERSIYVIAADVVSGREVLER